MHRLLLIALGLLGATALHAQPVPPPLCVPPAGASVTVLRECVSQIGQENARLRRDASTSKGDLQRMEQRLIHVCKSTATRSNSGKLRYPPAVASQCDKRWISGPT